MESCQKKKELDGAKGFWFMVFPCPFPFRFAVKLLRLSLLMGMLHSFACIFVP
jgi:hypothetical protein